MMVTNNNAAHAHASAPRAQIKRTRGEFGPCCQNWPGLSLSADENPAQTHNHTQKNRTSAHARTRTKRDETNTHTQRLRCGHDR